MRRISHDLAGSLQRITKLTGDFEIEAQEIGEVWTDAKAVQFLRQHTQEVPTQIRQLTSALTQSIELFEEIAKRVRDPDQV